MHWSHPMLEPCGMSATVAWEVFENTFPAPEKYMYLYTLFRRRRSAYIHLSGAGEAREPGEAGEVFICTGKSSDFFLIILIFWCRILSQTRTCRCRLFVYMQAE